MEPCCTTSWNLCTNLVDDVFFYSLVTSLDMASRERSRLSWCWRHARECHWPPLWHHQNCGESSKDGRGNVCFSGGYVVHAIRVRTTSRFRHGMQGGAVCDGVSVVGSEYGSTGQPLCTFTYVCYPIYTTVSSKVCKRFLLLLLRTSYNLVNTTAVVISPTTSPL